MIFIYLVLLVISVLFYILYKGVISFLILIFAVSLPILLAATLFYVRRRLSASLILSARKGSAGQSVPLEIELSNASILPVPNCEITLGFALSSSKRSETIRINTPIFPKNSQRLSVAFSSEHYGIVNCHIVKIKIFDMLRIFRTTVPAKRIRSGNNSIMILPESLELTNAVSDYSELGLDSESFSSSRPGDDPSEIFSIHEYADGDKLSKIHWKLTAKEDKLMVKDYSLPLADSFLIISDTFLPTDDPKSRAELYDTVIKLTVSVSKLLMDNDLRHRLAVFNEKDRLLEEISVSDEASYIAACTKLLSSGISPAPSLAAAQLIGDSETPRKYGHMILITASLDRKTVDMLSAEALAYRFTVLLCSDKEVPPQSVDLESNAEIIQIKTGAIEQSLGELVF